MGETQADEQGEQEVEEETKKAEEGGGDKRSAGEGGGEETAGRENPSYCRYHASTLEVVERFGGVACGALACGSCSMVCLVQSG